MRQSIDFNYLKNVIIYKLFDFTFFKYYKS